MSTETWIKEHYPESAHTFNIINIFPGFVSPIDVLEVEIEAIKHSIQKWKGLRKENLEKHEVQIIDDGYANSITDADDDDFMPSAENCALCNLDEDGCGKCPLYLARGNIACIDEKTTESISPWRSWEILYDPEPMIAELEMTLEKYEKIKENYGR